MKRIKHLLGIIYISCCLILLPKINLQAASNTLHEIDMKIVISEDGSVQVAETWDITVETGTEIYKEMRNMTDITVRDFVVTQGEMQFETLDGWDSRVSREEKTGKAGIIKKGNTYELCLGVGAYGRNQYTMYYTLDKYIEKYQDMYGINWQLLNADMSKPAIMQVDIAGHGIDENTSVYAFGFEGEVHVEKRENVYHLLASNRKEDGNRGRIRYMNVLAGFSNNTFADANTEYSHRTFANIVDEAKVGSDYIQENTIFQELYLVLLNILVLFFTPQGCLFWCVLFIIRFVRPVRKKREIRYTDGTIEKIRELKVDYYRDIPCNKDLYFFYYILTRTDMIRGQRARSGLLTGVLMDWIRKGHVEFMKLEKKGFFSAKDSFEIHFVSDKGLTDDLDITLYRRFKEAAGKNGILENREFEKWCMRHYEKLDIWFSSVDTQMEERLKQGGYTQKEYALNKILFLFHTSKTKKLYTPKFRQEVRHTKGFEKFLLEFGSMGEKQTKEVFLWEEYLIFASILGLAFKVEEEIGRIYPEFTTQSNLDIMYTTVAIRSFATAGIRGGQYAKASGNGRSSGGGGRSSFGGGGSSFRGGGGGGVR